MIDILSQHYDLPGPVVHEGAAMLRPVGRPVPQIPLNPPRFAPDSPERELLGALGALANDILHQPTTEQWQTIKNAILALAPEPHNAT